MPDRDAILDAAKYLRNVRPLDPEELREYVEDQPHPAVVRRVLREAAVALGLVEREDGTFVPAGDEPVPTPSLPVERLPERYARVLEDLLVERYGPDWHRDESGAAIRETLRSLKRAYHRGWDVDYGEREALAYAIYHLPDYYAAVQYCLAEFAEVELLDRQLRICDVGAGVGGPALGIHDALPEDALVQYDAVEPAAGADVLEAMLAETGRNVHAEVHRSTAEAFDGPAEVAAGDREPYDLVLFGNVLSELDDPARTARRYVDAVAEDGTLLLLSPADRHTARTLRVVERALADGDVPDAYADLVDGSGDTTGAAGDAADGPDDAATVFSPTVRLWPDEAPTDEGWSFVVRPDLDVPAFQRKLDEAPRGGTDRRDHGAGDGADDGTTDDADDGAGGRDGHSAGDTADDAGGPVDAGAPGDAGTPGNGGASRDTGAPGDGEFVNVDVQYSYAILRRDDERRVAFRPDRSRFAKFAESERHVTDRVDCAAIKLSGDLADGGNPLFRVGDGSERADHFAVLTKETALNADLRAAAYGDLLTLESVLVLWNDDEEAFNLVVDDETVVDAAPAPVR